MLRHSTAPCLIGVKFGSPDSLVGQGTNLGINQNKNTQFGIISRKSPESSSYWTKCDKVSAKISALGSNFSDDGSLQYTCVPHIPFCAGLDRLKIETSQSVAEGLYQQFTSLS